MLRMEDHPSLCPQHRQQLQPETDPKTIATELLRSIEDFKTATAVNHALGRLFALLAGNRIPPRNAAILAYICQLLLNTLPAVEQEITYAKGFDHWQRILRQVQRNLRSPKSSYRAESAQDETPETVVQVLYSPQSSDRAETIPKRATQAPSANSRTTT
jgi:hypothetical protein